MVGVAMYIDRNAVSEFPFVGSFSRTFVDESKPLDQQTEEEVVVLSTKCDIQESQDIDTAGMTKASFDVFFPIPEEGLKIKRGDYFRADMYGLEINGKVIGISPSQLRKCKVSIKDYDI